MAAASTATLLRTTESCERRWCLKHRLLTQKLQVAFAISNIGVSGSNPYPGVAALEVVDLHARTFSEGGGRGNNLDGRLTRRSSCSRGKLSPPGPSWRRGRCRWAGSSCPGSSCTGCGCRSSQSPGRGGRTPAGWKEEEAAPVSHGGGQKMRSTRRNQLVPDERRWLPIGCCTRAGQSSAGRLLVHYPR